MKTEPRSDGEFIVHEAPGSRSRVYVVLDDNVPGMEPGTVLGKITASGKYAAYNNAASDGTEVAAGILYSGKVATGRVALAIALDAVVNRSLLIGLDDAAVVDLRHLGIIIN